MRGQEKLIAGVIVGAGAMYLLDPDRGARRRSLLRDQGIHLGHKLGDGFAATARDVRNRSAGAAAELRSRLRHEQVDDEVLYDRVRSGSREQETREHSWTPATRLFLAAAGGVIALQGVRMRGPGGRALTFLGTGLLSRAASRVPARRVVAAIQAEPPADSVTSRATEPEPAAEPAAKHTAKATTKRRRSRR